MDTCSKKIVMDSKTEWIYCPVCGNKSRTRIRKDTELKNLNPKRRADEGNDRFGVEEREMDD